MSKFRFTTGEPPQQLVTDFQRIKDLDDNALSTLVDAVLSFLSGQNNDLMDQIPELSAATRISEGPLRNILQSSVFFFKGEMRASASPIFVRDDLIGLGLSESKANTVAARWKKMFLQLSRSAIGQALSINQIVDMQWKFGVTASSSESARVGASYLQLKIVLDKGDNTTEDVCLELTLPQFYEFFAEMQKAKANLEYFTG